MIEPKQVVRFVSGRYNGMEGVACWVGDNLASVWISWSGKQIEVIEDQANMVPLHEWRAGKTAVEIALRDGATP